MNKKPMKKIKTKNKQKVKKSTLKPTKKRGKKVLRGLFLICIISACIYLSYYLLTEPKFNILNIQVKGSTRYTEEQIVQASKVKKGTNIFKVLTSQISKNLSKYSYIKEIKLERKMPNTLIMKIIERNVNYLAYDIKTDKYIRIDKDGIILEIVDTAKIEENEMLTFGIDFPEKITLKEKLVKSELEKLQLYEGVLEKYNTAKILKKITSINFEDDTIRIVLEYNLSVILQEKDLEYNIGNLNTILTELEGKSGVLDMTKPSPIYTEKIN